MKGGNSCLFFIFTVLNFALLVVGATIGGSGIYLWTITKSANYFTMSFLGAGVFVMLIASCSFCLKNSTFRLSIYILTLLLLSAVQVTGMILFITERDRVLDWATEHISGDKESKSWKEAKGHIEDNLDISRYIIIGSTVLTVIILFFAMFYRCSVSSNKSDEKEKHRQEDRYERMSNDIQNAREKKDEKARLYAEKYNLNNQNNNQMV
mmetsp:Transcript_7653/g.6779  ORF Transcript_7653/g.6779 Transcript_7653/m.6779 type:complete len:209 (-) Transcript_7653:63-689(-)